MALKLQSNIIDVFNNGISRQLVLIKTFKQYYNFY